MLPDVAYFNFSFLKNTTPAECWDLLCLRLRVWKSHVQYKRKQTATVTLTRLESAAQPQVYSGGQGQV